MKKFYLKNLLALFLSGTMLGVVGCKDYDDDIDSINKRLDGMEVKVAGIDEQIAAIEGSISSLNELKSQVAALTTDLSAVEDRIDGIDTKIAAIGDVQKKLDALEATLKSYVDNATHTTEQTLQRQIDMRATVDQLEKAIADLRTELIRQINETANSIASLISRITALETDTTTSTALTELQNKIAALQRDISALQEQIKTQAGADQKALEALKKELNDKIAALQTQLTTALQTLDGKADQSALDALKEKIEALETAMRTEAQIKSLISAEIENLKSATWLAEQIDNAITEVLNNKKYVTAEQASDKTVTDLLQQLNQKEGDFYAKLIDLINGSKLTDEAIEQAIQNYLENSSDLIAKLRQRLDELENRIQSLVFVPSNTAEASNIVYVSGSPYIEFPAAKQGDEPVKYYLLPALEGESTKGSFEMTFRVSPASFVKKIAAENVELVVEKIDLTLTRAAAPAFEIVKVTAATTDPASPEYGKFTVAAKTDYTFGSEEGKTLAVALRVKLGNAASTSATAEKPAETFTGTEFTTAYIALAYEHAGKIDDTALVVAKATTVGEGDNAVTTYEELPYASRLRYHVTEPVTFFEGFAVYYKQPVDGGSAPAYSYTPLADLWRNAPVLNVAPVKSNDQAHASANTSNYDLQTLTMAIKTPDTKLIDNVITSPEFAFTLKAEGVAKSKELAKSKQTVTIESDNTDTHLSASIAWNYYKATAKQYAVTDVQLTEKLTAEQYNAVANGSVLKEQYVVLPGKTEADKIDMTAAAPFFALTSSPKLDTDSQFLDASFAETFAQKGAYKFVAVYTLDDKTTVTITMTVDADGAPALSKQIEAPETMYITTLQFELLKKYGEAVWNNSLAAAFKKNDSENNAAAKKNFLDIVKTLVVTDQDADKMISANTNEGTLYLTFPKVDYAKSYEALLELGDASGLSIAYTTTARLTRVSGSLTANEIYIVNGMVYPRTNFVGNKFDVEEKPLSETYYYAGTALKPEQIVISYELSVKDKAQADAIKKMATADRPSVSEDYKLVWNKWSQRELKIDAVLTLASDSKTELDRKTFTAQIEDPLADQAIAVAKDAGIIYAGEALADRTFNVNSLLTLRVNDETKTNLFEADGVNADLTAALGSTIGYTIKTPANNPLVSVDEKTGVVTFTGESSLAIQNGTIVVTVSYADRFHPTQIASVDVTIEIKDGARPAENPGN